MSQAEAPAPKRSFLATLSATARDRTVLAMLLLGLGAGLPYAALIGTLNAWFTNADVDVSTIGVLSWIGLAYAFKFLWSPALHRSNAPWLSRRFGPRRGWMLGFQLVIILAMLVIAANDPRTALPLIAVAALVGVIASASQDIVIDAWRIEIARDAEHLDTLSAVYQFGYRGAAILSGAVAFVIAQRIGWNITFFLLAATMLAAVIGVLMAREPDRKTIDPAAEAGVRLGAKVSTRTRNLILGAVLVLWGWAILVLGGFMAETLLAEVRPNARDFIRETGPWIVAATILAPAFLAVFILRLDPSERPDTVTPTPAPGRIQPFMDALYRAILEPLIDIIKRLGWAAPLVLLLILSYRFTDLVWGAFAYPFYLGSQYGALGHTLDEVALASNVIGVIITIAGVAVGGVCIRVFGRMSCLIAGAVLAAATNLLFWDLALGAPLLGGFLSLIGGYSFFALFGIDAPLANLITAIAGENLAVGFASVVFVAYLSSIVNPRYAAVQYALLASLTMLIGTLGRGALGEVIEAEGYAFVFILTALLGLVAVAASAAEAVRQRFWTPPIPSKDEQAPSA